MTNKRLGCLSIVSLFVIILGIFLVETCRPKWRGSVEDLAFSPDGKIMAVAVSQEAIYPVPIDGPGVASSSYEVRLLDLAARRQMAIVKGHTNTILSVTFSPDGGLLASGSSDFSAKIWNVATLSEERTLRGFAWDLAFSPDGKTLASPYKIGLYERASIALWETATGKQKAILKDLKDDAGIWFVPCFFYDGKLLVIRGEDGNVKVWEPGVAQPIAVLRVDKYLEPAGISPDGRILALTDGLRTKVQLWDFSAGKRLATLEGPAGAAGQDTFNCIAFAPDGKMLASGAGLDDTVVLWDVAEARKTTAFLAEKRDSDEWAGSGSVAFSPDGRILAAAYEGYLRREDVTVVLWDLATGEHQTILMPIKKDLPFWLFYTGVLGLWLLITLKVRSRRRALARKSAL